MAKRRRRAEANGAPTGSRRNLISKDNKAHKKTKDVPEPAIAWCQAHYVKQPDGYWKCRHCDYVLHGNSAGEKWRKTVRNGQGSESSGRLRSALTSYVLHSDLSFMAVLGSFLGTHLYPSSSLRLSLAGVVYVTSGALAKPCSVPSPFLRHDHSNRKDSPFCEKRRENSWFCCRSPRNGARHEAVNKERGTAWKSSPKSNVSKISNKLSRLGNLGNFHDFQMASPFCQKIVRELWLGA